MSTDESVPEEVIAEGSSPHDAEELAAAAEHVFEADEGAEPVEPVELAGAEASPETAEGGEGAENAEPADAAEGAEPSVVPQALDDAQLKKLIEALVFAADKPVTVARLRQLSRVSDTRRIEQALEQLAEDYRDCGIALQQVSGGYQLRTATAFSPWVQQLVAGRPVRLTRAQLETLAIVAYRQPITRPEIDQIRGVDSSNTLRVLAERALVRILGKREEVGRPLLYGTTKEFLDFFSLSDLRELPTLREYSELTAESRQVVARQDEAAEAESSEAEAAFEEASGLGPRASGDEAAEMAQAVEDYVFSGGVRPDAGGPDLGDGPDLAEGSDLAEGADLTGGPRPEARGPDSE